MYTQRYLSGFYEKSKYFRDIKRQMVSYRYAIPCKNSFCVCVCGPKIRLKSHESHNFDPNTFSPAFCQQRHLCA